VEDVFSVKYGMCLHIQLSCKSCPQARQLYRIEILRPQGHLLRAVMHGDKRQGTFCVMWINEVFKVLRYITVVGFI